MMGDQSDNKPPSTNKDDDLVGLLVFGLLNFFLLLPPDPAIVNRCSGSKNRRDVCL